MVPEANNALFCPSHEKIHTVVSNGDGNISGTLLESRCEISRVRQHLCYFSPPDGWFTSLAAAVTGAAPPPPDAAEAAGAGDAESAAESDAGGSTGGESSSGDGAASGGGEQPAAAPWTPLKRHDTRAFTEEAINRPNIPLQRKFHMGILPGLRNISDTS